MPNLDMSFYSKDESKIARFPLAELKGSIRLNLWTKRNIALLRLKEILKHHGLQNGKDYVFLQSDNAKDLPVMFEDAENVTFFMLAYECQKNR